MASLSMKFLAGLGVDEEKAELIGERHKEVLKEILAERDKYKEEAEKVEDLQKQLKVYKDLEAKSEKDPFKVKYEALKEDFENYKTEQKNKEIAQQKNAAIKALLKEIGIADKRIDAVMKVTDTSDITLDENGKIEGASELKKSLKAEWADFITTQTSKGAQVATPPTNTGGTAVKTREEIRKIKDTTERQKAWAEYIEAQKGM